VTDPLEGCRKKVERAGEHLQAFDKAVQAWGDLHPYGIDQQLDPDTSEHVVRVRKLRHAPLIDWAVVLSDAIHSLRSTLDHLVCVMVRQPPAGDCVGTGFPIISNAADWDRRRKGRLAPASGLAKLRGTDSWTQSTIKGLQPFNDRQEAGGGNALRILNALANIDKHRALHLAEFFLYSPELRFSPSHAGEVTWVHPGGPLEDGAEVLRYRLAWGFDQSKVKTETKLGADIVFDQGSPADGMKIAGLLGWLRDYVEWIIDLFGYRYFGGEPPSGFERTTLRVARSASS